MVKKAEVKFVASDGVEFDSEEAAKHHEELREALGKYEAARKAYARWLWEEQITADGQRFSLTSMRDYYFIGESWAFPEMRRVSFCVWNCELDDTDVLTILVLPTGGSREPAHVQTYRINQLYQSRAAAKRALVKAQKERIAQLTEQMRQSEKESK